MKIIFTLNNLIVVSFQADETANGGLTFGPNLLGQDIHLTIFDKEGKLRSHIHHGGADEPKDSPIGKTTSDKVIRRNLEKFLRKRLRTYHGNKKCFIFTHERLEHINTLLPKFDKQGDLVVPLKLFAASLDVDFNHKELWENVKIRSLLIREPHFGFMKSSNGLRLVWPLSKNHILIWPLRKVNEISDYLLKVSGFDDLFDYLEDIGVSKKIRSDLRKIQTS